MNTMQRETFVLVGKCGVCGTGYRRTSTFLRSADQMCGRCIGLSIVHLSRVTGRVTAKRCDARCTSATSRVCSCQCGGKQHGRDHDIRPSE